LDALGAALDSAGIEYDLLCADMAEVRPKRFDCLLGNPPFSVHLQSVHMRDYACTNYGRPPARLSFIKARSAAPGPSRRPDAAAEVKRSGKEPSRCSDRFRQVQQAHVAVGCAVAAGTRRKTDQTGLDAVELITIHPANLGNKSG
jgi:hypothetical protein